MTSSGTSARRILAVFNPAAGRARRARFDAVLDVVRAFGCVVSVVETTAPGHGELIARDADPAAFDVIAAAGGDGTINEIVNGLGEKNIALGIIPLGTANVLADEIGLSGSTDSIARALAVGPERQIHVGRANGRRFTMMAGVGFDANVVSGVSLGLKRRLGALAYVWQSIKQAARDPFAPCDVTIDGVPYHPVSAVVCKGRRYGGPFIAARAASLSDDRFQVALMNGRGALSVLRYGFALVIGRLAIWRDVQIIAGRHVTIQGIAGQPVQADGDIVARLPVQIDIDPSPLRVVFPV